MVDGHNNYKPIEMAVDGGGSSYLAASCYY